MRKHEKVVVWLHSSAAQRLGFASGGTIRLSSLVLSGRRLLRDPHLGLLGALKRLGRVEARRDHQRLELGEADRGGVIVVGLVVLGLL